MPELSQEQQLEAVCSELQELTIRRHQLNERLNLLRMLNDFQQNSGFKSAVLDSNKEEECGKIEEELKKLSKRKRDLQAKKDYLDATGVAFSPVDGVATPFGSQIFIVEKPPSYPAPQVILDVTKLPPQSSPTQCPYCQQYITTEVRKVSGNTARLVCMVCICLGGIAGCCLIPFCINNFKDVVHKCPKCRSQIHVCTKL